MTIDVEEYSPDPIANAILNAAAAIDRLSNAIRDLGFNLSTAEGPTIADAIDGVAAAIQEGASLATLQKARGD